MSLMPNFIELPIEKEHRVLINSKKDTSPIFGNKPKEQSKVQKMQQGNLPNKSS
jgi:hypothetical protein